MIGIYKITNQKNKVYIGQSITLEKRILRYKKLKCEEQPKIYRSLFKYGVEDHKFEIIEECSIELLNERERYWQEHYNVLENGLNCVFTKTNEKKQLVSNETKLKISNLKKGNLYWLGKKHTKESKYKMRKANEGKILSDEIKLKVSNSLKNHIVSNETKLKISENNSKFWKNKKRCLSTKEKMSESKKWKKIILDVNTGIFYSSILDAEKIYNIKKLGRILNGNRKNKTSLILV